MEIHTNKELAQAVSGAIKEGYQGWEKLASKTFLKVHSEEQGKRK